MASNVINTRADLDAIAGTPEHAAFMSMLDGTLWRFEKDDVAKTWVLTEDNTTIERFGFVRSDFAGAQAPALPEYVGPDVAAEMERYLDEFKALRLLALGRLDGRQSTALTQSRMDDATAIETAKQGLRDMTTHATVLAATTGDEMRIALKNRYYEISAVLYADAPAEYIAFKALDL